MSIERNWFIIGLVISLSIISIFCNAAISISTDNREIIFSDTLIKKLDSDSTNKVEALNKRYAKYKSIVYAVTSIEMALIGATVVDSFIDPYDSMAPRFFLIGGLLLLIPIIACDRFEGKVEDSGLSKNTRKKYRWRANKLLLLSAFVLGITFMISAFLYFVYAF